MANDLIKVVLVDDEVRALNRLKLLLSNFPETIVLNQFEHADECIEFIIKNEPDLVFLDIEMPGKSGLEIAEDINKNFIDSKIVFITAHEHYAIKAIKNNVFDYLLKPVGIDELKNCIERYKSKHHNNLSKRELEIIRAISEGLNSREIGEKLFISRHTVDTYRRTILEKTSCHNAAELIKYAVKHDMI